ncbi:hypothetical protein GCM10023339_40900 [Alloalcanivorax gelatiniphagus]
MTVAMTMPSTAFSNELIPELLDSIPPTGTDSGPHVSSDAFRDLFRNYAAGVSVVTADSGHGPVAMTATSVTCVSVDPPILVLSVSDGSSAAPVIRNAETVIVHLLDTGDVGLAKLCATSGVDRFGGQEPWVRLTTGEAVFPRVRNWVRGSVVSSMRLGTSTVMAVRALGTSDPDRTAGSEPVGPLVYHDRSWHALGAASQIPER